MFKTLNDLKDQKKEEKKKSVDFYTGGSKSGLAVTTPEEDQNISKQIAKSAAQPKGESVDVKITLYKNGFVVNDEPFRAVEQPENAAFLKELKSGHVPPELAKKFNRSINVGLVDKSEENYEKPKPMFEKMGYKSEDVSKFIGTKSVDQEAQKFTKIDSAKAITPLSFRLPDGTSKMLEFNITEKIESVIATIAKAFKLPQPKITLLIGFPPKPITNIKNTIEELKLQKSSIIVKVI